MGECQHYKIILISCPLLHTRVSFSWRVMGFSFVTFIYYFCLFRGKKKRHNYGWFLEQPLLNAWTRGAVSLAPFLDKGVTSSSMHILPYIYLTPFPSFLLFQPCWPLKESPLPFEPCFHQLVNLVTLAAIIPSRPFSKEPFTCKFFSSFPLPIFFILVDQFHSEAVNLGS